MTGGGIAGWAGALGVPAILALVWVTFAVRGDPIGQRLVEVATGCTWWVDEVPSGQPEVVGVIPDDGCP